MLRSQGEKLIYHCVFVINLSCLYANRVLGAPSDDFTNYYYPRYLDLYNGLGYSEFHFGSISFLEIGIPTLLTVLSFIPFLLSPHQVLLFFTLLIFSCLSIFYLRLFKGKIFYCQLAMLLSPLGVASFLLKQSVAVVLFLVAWASKFWIVKIFFLSLSLLCHLAMIIPIVLMLLERVLSTKMFYMFVAITSCSIYFSVFILLEFGLGLSIDKLDFYNRSDIWESKLNYVTATVIVFHLLFLIMCDPKSDVKKLLISNGLVALSVIALPLATYRVGLMQVSFLLSAPILLWLIKKHDDRLILELMTLALFCIAVVRLLPKVTLSGFNQLTANYTPLLQVISLW